MDEARAALQSYDYVNEDGRWYHKRKHNTTQSWTETEGGFLRFDPDNGGWYPVPYKIKAEFASIGGLDFRYDPHMDFFDWVWPAEYVGKMYRDAWEAMKAHAEAREAEKRAYKPAPVVEVMAAEPEPVVEEPVVEEVVVVPPAEVAPKSFLDKLFGT